MTYLNVQKSGTVIKQVGKKKNTHSKLHAEGLRSHQPGIRLPGVNLGSHLEK